MHLPRADVVIEFQMRRRISEVLAERKWMPAELLLAVFAFALEKFPRLIEPRIGEKLEATRQCDHRFLHGTYGFSRAWRAGSGPCNITHPCGFGAKLGMRVVGDQHMANFEEIKGACFCGANQFAITQPAVEMHHCHCS